ncbi:MAG: WcaF family extracellular polysaccharide biosynthesis acetyltransferase [Ferruginibacter sp.]
MPVNLSIYNNDFYKPGNSIKRYAWYLVNEVVFKTGLFPFYTLKRFFLKLFGAKMGRGILIKPGVNIKYPWLLDMGDFIWIGEGVWIDNLARVSIGNNVCVSQGALLLCGNHDYTTAAFNLSLKPIVIEEGVWIGAKSIVCGGVTCRSHSILSVGSVANGDMQAYGIYSGNPAQEIKKRVIKEG